jgi:PTS system fructose-specific IIA component
MSVTGIHEILRPQTISVGLPGSTKDEVLLRLIDLLRDHPGVQDLEGVREAVLAREQVMSTGVGKGLGLPHAKTPAVSETVVAFAITEEPVPFGAIDNQPVQLLFLLVDTEGAKAQHIKVLSRVSRLMNRDAFRQRLLEARDAQEVLALFAESEAELLEN